MTTSSGGTLRGPAPAAHHPSRFQLVMVRLTVIAAGLLAGMMAHSALAQAGLARDAGHALHHADHYQHWKMPGTDASCCNAKVTEGMTTRGDCFPTEAEMRRGQWWAKTDAGKWVRIPDDKILKEHNPDPEAAHLCYDYQVRCFVPPNTGF